MRKLVLVGATAAAALGVYGCASVGRNAFAEPVVTLRDVKLQGIGLTGGSFDVILSVYNPNGYRLDAAPDQLQPVRGLAAVRERHAQSAVHSAGKRFHARDGADQLFVRRGGRSGTAASQYRVGELSCERDVTVATPVGSFKVPYDRTGRFSALGGASR